MKKIFAIIIAAVAMLSIEANAQTAKCLLSHNGNVTLYDASSISSAITAAAVGDTIYLSEGSFPGFTISKNVSFIGAGETSIINGSVTVNISGTTTFTNILLEGAKITGSLTISSATNNLRIRSCKIGDTSVSGTANNLTFEKCYFTSTFTPNPTYVKSGTVLNSKIYELSGTCSTTTFVNCNICYISQNISSTFLNSILFRVKNAGSDYKIPAGNYLTNCLYSYYYINTSQCVTKSCTSIYGSDLMSVDMYVSSTYLNGVLGNDGTVVGCNGGTSPFTLRPLAPTVTSASMAVDTNNQTLNVNIQVTAQ